jgi:hypothetical protein
VNAKKDKTPTPPADGDYISRDDVESKIRQFTGDVNDTAERMTRVGAAVGAGVLMVLLILIFIIGRSKGKKKTTIVEVIRI